ncbi:glycosyltransferase family 52 [Butyrivibrio sp. NC2002]|uniref:glycosyltransferase family 52 n=1 Tax=Butyrivibrio sp. NC2002 TaxID=1410610 RepID=UPI000563E0CC|nr:glycosyltransferase family 52 [Butyrivibrio sp. NC2002]
MHDRIYVCHTFYHVYVACLKEFHILHEYKKTEGFSDKKAAGGSDGCGRATLVLSKMSNKFGSMVDRARECGLFEEVIEYDEKIDTFFPELAPLKTNTGSLFKNMINRIKFCRRFGQLQEKYVPVDFKAYKDIYVFCDSDPIGYYLNYKKIRYHALEDGLNCIKYGDQARYDNNGHFRFKAFMAKTGLIFIQNGWGRYCIDMEVNDISILDYPCPKYIEVRREPLVDELTRSDKELMLKLFVENMDELKEKLAEGKDKKRVLILSEPLCDLDTRQRLFRDLVTEYGEGAVVMIKQHPRDYLDYAKYFPDVILLAGTFPMEMLNFIDGLKFDKLVSVYTVVDSIRFVDEKIFLGDDFMDKYEAPEIHRLNEQIIDN